MYGLSYKSNFCSVIKTTKIPILFAMIILLDNPLLCICTKEKRRRNTLWFANKINDNAEEILREHLEGYSWWDGVSMGSFINLQELLQKITTLRLCIECNFYQWQGREFTSLHNALYNNVEHNSSHIFRVYFNGSLHNELDEQTIKINNKYRMQNTQYFLYE